MDILDDMGVSKFSAKIFLKVNYSFNALTGSFVNTAFHVYRRQVVKVSSYISKKCFHLIFIHNNNNNSSVTHF